MDEPSAPDGFLRALAAAEETTRSKPRLLNFAPFRITITENAEGAIDWLTEFFSPFLSETPNAQTWQLALCNSSQAYRECCLRRPLEPPLRPCFAFDQHVLALPAWSSGRGVAVQDAERSCFFHVSPFAVNMVTDPSSCRWRFTLMRIVNEIMTTRLRRTQLDIHAAAVETDNRAVLISGPKQAGKTTLSFHLLRSGRCRMIANDRTFIGLAQSTPPRLVVRGVPTMVKIRPATLAGFPELYRGLLGVERPYLYALAELAHLSASAGPPDLTEFALSPVQLAQRLQVERVSEAPLGAIIFPQIRSELEGFTAERMAPPEVSAMLWANLYGAGLREPTLFEQLDGGRSTPSPSLADAIAEAVPGYRVTLGRAAYQTPDFASRLLESLFA